MTSSGICSKSRMSCSMGSWSQFTVCKERTDWSVATSPIVDGGVCPKYRLVSCDQDMSGFSTSLRVDVLLIVMPDADSAYPVTELLVLGLNGDVSRPCGHRPPAVPERIGSAGMS